MIIVISGANGLIGSGLVDALSKEGERVLRLVRASPKHDTDILWDPARKKIELSKLEGVDAVIHLSGETVAQRWTEPVKKRIIDSRIESTRFLSETITALTKPPSVFVSASAIGFYGDCGADPVSEDSKQGNGFLADLCKNWEEAAAIAQTAGIRTVNLRIGMVLSRKGGALAKMLTPFLLGAGGRLGDGKQFISWISLDDLIECIQFVIKNETMSGPVNAVSPESVTNAQFTKALAEAIKRPALFPVPAFALRILFGQMAEEMLLSGAIVKPDKLVSAGFKFHYPVLKDALTQALR